MIWNSIILFLTKNWKKVLVAVLCLAVIALSLRFVSPTSKSRVWVFGPKERVTIKIK